MRVRTPPRKYAPWDIRTVGRRPRLMKVKRYYIDVYDWPYHPYQAILALVNLLVCGETPHEAAKDVSNPEEGVDQHRLVVFLTHPVVLKQDRNAQKRSTGIGSWATSLVMVGKILVWSYFQPSLHGFCFSVATIKLKSCLEEKDSVLEPQKSQYCKSKYFVTEDQIWDHLDLWAESVIDEKCWRE